MGYSCRNKQFLFFSYITMPPPSKKIPHILQADIYHFGIDMLEILGNYRNEGELLSIDFWKSNSIQIEEFTVKRFEINNYLYKAEFKLNDRPLFAFYKWNKGDPTYLWTIKTNDYFCFYASAFRLLGDFWVLELMYRFWIQNRWDCIKRFDLCMDIPFRTTEVYETFENVRPTKTLFYWTNNEVETFYIGKKQSTENKHSLIRVYNKLLDIHKKWKEKEYIDYFQQGRMTRLEIEFRRELARNTTLEELFVPENQMDLFLTQFNKYTKLFKNFSYNKQSLFRKREKRDWEMLSSFDKTQRVKVFLAYAEKIGVTLGICPIQLLFEKHIFLANTVDMIDKYGINNFISILHRNRHWKTNINSILDRNSLYDSDKWV